MMTSLKGEDSEAWKFYEKQNEHQTALKYCRSGKQRCQVAAIIANKMIEHDEFEEAAEYFIQSGLRFETVCLKYIQAGRTFCLIAYLKLVLEKLKTLSGLNN